jgi:hypothetical protein
MEIKRIDLLEKPASDQYSVAAHFTLQLQQALSRKGIDCRLIKEKDYFIEPLLRIPDITMQFNDCPKNSQGKLLCDLTGVPHVALLLDPPFRVLDLISNRNMIFTCEEAYWNEILDHLGFHNHFFLPHAAGKDLLAESEGKKYDVIMLATCIDYEAAFRLIQCHHPKVRIALNLAVAKALSDCTLPYGKAVLETVQKIVPGDYWPKLKLSIFFRIIEMYLKGKDRTELAKSIKDAEVHVFGNDPTTSWEHFLGGVKNIRLHDGVSFDKALELMRQTKILLNSSIKNVHGAHERIFIGLLSGALVVTHENPYLSQYFKDEESILFYRHNELQKLNGKVMKYLKDEPRRKEIVQRGQEVVLKYHTWEERAATLLDKLPPIIQRILDSSTK